MDDDNKVGAWMVAAALVVGLLLGLLIGWKTTSDAFHAELVQRHLGEWKVINEHGRTEFWYVESLAPKN
jgi:uncharacterized membrane-anchored protein YhcB (DUF1043 family)